MKTVSGNTEYRRNCRKIKDKYYVSGEECFLIGDTWYANTSKLITYDYEKEIYVLIKDTPLVYGVVGFKEDGVHEMGYFTENKYNNILVNIHGYGSIWCFNQATLEKGGFVENLSDGLWYYKKNHSASALAGFKKITSKKVYRDKGYNIEDNKQEFDQKIKSFAASPFEIPTKAHRMAKYLGNTTFGMEIETALGYLPEHIQSRHGVVICRDGSIDNAEFVTVPMQGARGLANIKHLSTELCKRTIPDIKCSFHIHLGTLPDHRLFIVALWALSIKIQDELYTMFPGFKTHWEKFKKKDYNQKTRKLGFTTLKPSFTKDQYLAYIDDAYYRISKFLNEGNEPDDRFNRQNHQHVRTAKWERAQRYYWINFMNMFFSERKTIEFRLHQATTNGQKMTNWLFICNAIVKYAQQNPRKILSSPDTISLNEVMDYYKDTFKSEEAGFLSDYMKAYIADRKAYFANDIAKGDYESKKELQTDKDYVFEYKGVLWLF